MPTLCSAAEIVAGLKPGMSVYVPGVSGESLAFLDALKANPEACAGLRFTGLHFPGINRSDYLALHATARQRAYVMQPGLRAGFKDGRAELLPLDYPGIYRDLAANVEIDLAIAQLTPPDAEGWCSTGLSCDFLPAVWAKARRRVAHLNPRLPRTAGSFRVRYDELDAAFEADHALLEYDAGEANATMRAQAALVASLVRDGDVLEFGIGKLQAGILDALHSHRQLSVWSGMASAPVLGLLDSGAIRGRASINLGVALGDAAFYARIGRDDSFHFRPVGETHDVRRIAALENFCAINSAIEVDLFGQVNADCVGGRLAAGVGGLPAFVAGALLAPNGRSIIALPAATDDGAISRIVATLGDTGLAALPRHAADYVVTEHGIASLRGLGLQQRAEALIAIAAPAFRAPLAARWAEIAQRL
ncbi:MAG: acetyl-CoA hydrolase/transferase C-terminal domain-containing protein [Nevskia sp.]